MNMIKNIELENIDIICIIGGDGTIHECINGIMFRKNEKDR